MNISVLVNGLFFYFYHISSWLQAEILDAARIANNTCSVCSKSRLVHRIKIIFVTLLRKKKLKFIFKQQLTLDKTYFKQNITLKGIEYDHQKVPEPKIIISNLLHKTLRCDWHYQGPNFFGRWDAHSPLFRSINFEIYFRIILSWYFTNFWYTLSHGQFHWSTQRLSLKQRQQA